jgi:Toprim-like
VGLIPKLRIRRFGSDIPKEYRYSMVSGSANGLYRAECIESGKPDILLEGEIDALSAAQETGNAFACVATGSTAHVRIPKWQILLSQAPRVFLCFDADPAGAEGITWWKERIVRAVIHRVPEAYHDVNDMLTQGGDIPAWLGVTPLSEMASPIVSHDTIDTNDTIPETPRTQSPKPAISWPTVDLSQFGPLNDRDVPKHCSRCGNAAIWWGDGCTPYCDSCWRFLGKMK